MSVSPITIYNPEGRMEKLTLKIDALHVETFQVDSAAAELRGTVQGHSTDGAGCPNSYPFPCLPAPWSEGCAN